MMLDDLEFQWKRGRLPSLLPAMELIMLAVLNANSPVKVWTSVAMSARLDYPGPEFVLSPLLVHSMLWAKRIKT